VSLVLPQSPPAIVRHLRADELALRTATGARFVAVARDRQLAIRALTRNANQATAVERLAPGERDDIAARRDLTRSRPRARPRSAA
jgi:hypothetical protein